MLIIIVATDQHKKGPPTTALRGFESGKTGLPESSLRLFALFRSGFFCPRLQLPQKETPAVLCWRSCVAYSANNVLKSVSFYLILVVTLVTYCHHFGS
jgi:hypothetical protein